MLAQAGADAKRGVGRTLAPTQRARLVLSSGEDLVNPWWGIV
jgi:hypothetical protein